MGLRWVYSVTLGSSTFIMELTCAGESVRLCGWAPTASLPDQCDFSYAGICRLNRRFLPNGGKPSVYDRLQRILTEGLRILSYHKSYRLKSMQNCWCKITTDPQPVQCVLLRMLTISFRMQMAKTLTEGRTGYGRVGTTLCYEICFRIVFVDAILCFES